MLLKLPPVFIEIPAALLKSQFFSVGLHLFKSIHYRSSFYCKKCTTRVFIYQILTYLPVKEHNFLELMTLAHDGDDGVNDVHDHAGIRIIVNNTRYKSLNGFDFILYPSSLQSLQDLLVIGRRLILLHVYCAIFLLSVLLIHLLQQKDFACYRN